MPWTTPGTAVAGDVLTAARWNSDVRDNSNMLYNTIRRLGYVTRTTSYTVDQTVIASAANLFSSSITFTADGTSSYLVEIYFPRVTPPANTATYVEIDLYNVTSSTGLGTVGFVQTNSATPEISTTVFAKYYWTPSAGSVTLNARAVRSAATASGAIYCGTGGTGLAYMPGYLAVFGPDLT
jgi:hypothetical protein